MSDYFAALMRASGLGQTPATTAATGTELSVLDLEIPAVAAPVSYRGTPQPARPETPAPVATPSVQAPATVQQPAAEIPRVAESPEPAAAVPTSRPVEPQTPPTATASREPLVTHQALMQSVMRWVADDQPAPVTAPVAERPAPLETPALAGERAITPANPPAARSVSASTVASVETLQAPSPVRPQLPAEPVARALATPNEPSPPPQPAAALREQPEPEKTEALSADGLSISIGAIHLRVEAPATSSQPSAAAKPSVQPAPRAPASAPSPTTRSSLSRRALRRI